MAAIGVARPNHGSAAAERGENRKFATPRPTRINNKSDATSMDQLINGANAVIRHMENTGQDEPIVTRFAITVRQFAEQAKTGGAQGEMAKVISALEAIAADTQRLNTRIDSIEKSATSSATSASTLSSTDRWKAFRAGAWQYTISVDPPINRSDGTASLGVSEVELREDRSIVIKVDPTWRDKIRQMEAKAIVGKAESLREKYASKKTSPALAGNAYFCAARVLLSGDVSMLVNSAAGAELLHRHTEWIPSSSFPACWEACCVFQTPHEIVAPAAPATSFFRPAHLRGFAASPTSAPTSHFQHPSHHHVLFFSHSALTFASLPPP
ncbi:uncharacterized protein N7503_001252 [Penicillium pulvis]|uniref:uncharacterized protein n=1 Tax=Penicillium pulvis TaxID=1562058 RepID=UPI002548A69A|nr:uncharacterized protein N7503_001252 [Penicillium pulvis]KAJ5809034.1 hypothetical protein N7503_001252 [Penicillium pulvis]